MKRTLFALISLFALGLAALAAEPQRYCLDVKDFAELKIIDGLNVEWRSHPDSVGLVTFTTTPDIVPNIMLQNNKKTLKIQLADTDFPLRHLPKITVYSSFLSKAENSGDSTLTVVNPPASAELKLRVVGNGTLTATGIHATTVEAKIDTGRGQITLDGQAQWVKLRNVGTGNINAAGLKAEKGSLTIGGTGDIECQVSSELTVTGLGSGKVYCTGNPATKNRTLGTVKVVYK